MAVVLLLFFLCIGATQFSSGNGDSSTGCRETEKLALLKFKQSLFDPSGRLSSWVGEDCCTWEGVRCSNRTGHVTKLLLRSPTTADEGDDPDEYYLRGEISPSLLELKHLRYLDLTGSFFDGKSIPPFIGSLTRLRYLNLSHTELGGIVPHQLGNLTYLRYLDLHNFHLVVDNLQWLSHLSSLQYLDMSSIDLTKADVFRVANQLPALSVLRLSGCNLRIPTSLPYVNFTSFTTLDLSDNYIASTFPDWLFDISSLMEVDLTEGESYSSISGFGNLSSLQVLKLGSNNFNGTIPVSFGSLCNLHTLDLSDNGIDGDISMLEESLGGCARYSLQTLSLEHNRLRGQLPDQIGDFRNLTALYLGYNLLTGSIPPSLRSLSSLRYLDLSNNGLGGPVAETIGQLSELVLLDLRFNSFEGVISDAHLANLTNLEDLYLSSNSLVVSTSSNWTPQFQLKNIFMESCVLGPQFPAWLTTQRVLSRLYISNASISDTMPDWVWNFSSQLSFLKLSHNQITGCIPVTLGNIELIDLRSNQFHGPLPRVDDGVVYLYLSNNLFSGDLLPIFSNTRSSLQAVLLSGNRVSGSIPSSICELFQLAILDLSNNLLSGEIPHCNGQTYWLVINLANNHLSGVIPHWIGSQTILMSLHLNNNSLHGEIPSLENCTALYTLDLGENRLTGKIPPWIGESLTYLRFLRLRSNKLEGRIPQQLSQLVNLQVLDLADNNLADTMPHWLANLSAMTSTEQKIDDSFTVGFVPHRQMGIQYADSLLVATKGMELEYSKTFLLVVSLDLSGNYLYGDIPEELTGLIGLRNLNLSKNRLTGNIPKKIGNLHQLESLDLSRNKLSGAIPSSISSLTFLSYLNLSNNNLSGRVPSGNQLQVLGNSSIYDGNADLCGKPLPKICPGDRVPEVPIPAASTGEGDDLDNLGYYLGAVLGFIMGFWGLFGTLLLKKSWRISYYKFIDRMTVRVG